MAPGRGELRGEDLPEPRPGRGAGPRAALRHQPGHRAARPPGRRAPRRRGGDAGAVPGGRPAGPGEVRLPARSASWRPGRRTCSAATVFCLHPHQDRYVVPAAALTAVPDGVPPRRAVLAGTVETAVNALWDAAPRLGDRVAVVGAGHGRVRGGRAAAPLPARPAGARGRGRAPGRRRPTGSASRSSRPDEAAGSCDLVVHASATGAGLGRGLELLGDEGELMELSWYGDADVPLCRSAADFHARRLGVRASQVGAVVAAARGPGAPRRPAGAWRSACCATRPSTPWSPARARSRSCRRPWTRLAGGDLDALCHVMDYP